MMFNIGHFQESIEEKFRQVQKASKIEVIKIAIMLAVIAVLFFLS